MTPARLAHLAERALKWSAVTTVARFALQLGAQVALARLLGPGNFGVYGIGMAVLTFAAFLCGASFSWNLMLLPQVTDEDVRFAFTWQLISGLLCACAMYAGAPAIATFFGDARVESVVQWLSLATLLTAASAPALCLLQRDLNFRTLGLVQLAAYAAGFLAVGVPMALAGYGAHALAAACVVQSAVTLVGAYAARPHPLRPLLHYTSGGDHLATGRAVFLTNVVNWLLSNLDRVVIGRVLNTHFVGLFTVAYNLASIPNVLLLSALQPAFLAAGAKMQNDKARLAQGWLLGLACVLVLVTPAAVVAAMLSADLVSFLYGAQWTESAWVLALLFLCLPAWSCWGLSTPVLWNTNRKNQEFLLQLPLLLLAAPAWWLFGGEGIRAVASVSAVVIYARAFVIITAALRALDLSWSVLAPHVARGLGLAALAAAAVLAGQTAASPFALPLLSLMAGGTCALAALALAVIGWPQVLGAQAQLAISRIVPRFATRWVPAAGAPIELEEPQAP